VLSTFLAGTSNSVADFDEKTRVTVVQPRVPTDSVGRRNDCLVVIYTKEATLLGKRFVLERSPMRAGRGADNHVVLDGDSVSRRHCHFESRSDSAWFVVDDNSTNGTYVNDEQISLEHRLDNGDRIKVGPTIFKYLSGTDVESQYHEEIYRLTIIDGLTQTYNKRYLFEALERELIRARRHTRDLSILMFDIDHFKKINDEHGHLAGDFVLKELAQAVQGRIRRDELVARYGGEEFVVMLPETPLEGARQLAETLRSKVDEHRFVFQSEVIHVSISIGCATLIEADKSATELLKRVDELLYEAKRSGRNKVCS
jgi:two-component system, cell cycle response regulator